MSEKKVTKRTRLSNPKEIRSYIASLIRRVEADDIEAGKARILMQLADTLLKAYRTDEIERKIMEIEQTLENGATAPTTGNADDDEFLRRVK